jgi:hypothetical protein
MATMSSLIDRVRVELGDLGKSFVTQFVADGTTNRFRLHYAPLDGPNVLVYKNGVDVSDEATIEESTGVLIMDEVPEDGDEITVSGNYYRYFTAAEMTAIINDAVIQHTAHSTDAIGRKLTLETLPSIEDYPVAIYAVTLALYTLATDSAFDIDVQAPDGVTIPRTERYRQLMQMIETRKEQYRELCTHLGIGMYKIDVFSLRRISKMTNRYVPVYVPQEVDDRSFAQRVSLPEPTYGDYETPWPTKSVELTAYQGRPFTADVSFEAPTGSELVAKILHQRGSAQALRNFTTDFVETEEGVFSGTISLTGNDTLHLANRTHWSIQVVEDGDTIMESEIKGGNFFTVRSSTVRL